MTTKNSKGVASRSFLNFWQRLSLRKRRSSILIKNILKPIYLFANLGDIWFPFPKTGKINTFLSILFFITTLFVAICIKYLTGDRTKLRNIRTPPNWKSSSGIRSREICRKSSHFKSNFQSTQIFDFFKKNKKHKSDHSYKSKYFFHFSPTLLR